jgi:uncharacterized membrane protein YfcA
MTMIMLQIAAGFAAGWLSALLGIGGGVILVPMMTFFFKVPIQQAVVQLHLLRHFYS